jgi:anti-anti-sigma regulatory factor
MADGLAITARRHGRVCALVISGELDTVTAEGFAARVLAAADGRADSLVPDLTEALAIDYPGVRNLARMTRGPEGERPRSLVVDLSGLRSIDGTGARALADLISGVSLVWPVLVRGASAAVRRVFDLTGFDIGSPARWAKGLSVRPVGELIDEGHDARSRARILRAHAREVAELIAQTGEQLAATLTELAGDLPHAADRLTALGQAARQQSADLRRWANGQGPLAA